MASYVEQGWLMDGVRAIISVLDNVIYFLISVLYQIFFNVANATLISGETIKAFYSRIQLILGILIMFKLAISLISGIMNPDSMSDEKKGFFGIIKRIVIALIMLVLIVPLNIPTSDLGDDGSYNSQLNNNGILFGTLYELQHIVLSQNTIARLILGVSSNVDRGDINRSAKEAGNELATIILKCFVTINVKSDEGDPMKHEDRMCQDSDSQEYIIDYLSPNITPAGIFTMINEYCEVDDSAGVAEIEEGSNYYVFNYSLFLSTVVGIFFVIILLGFIIDVAIRAFKLAILRLISPIPIISYVDPKSEQNGAFGAWVKAVTSTYIDLFMRLAIVYFILFMIQEFSINGIVMDVGSGAVGLFSKVFIILGLFFFAKEAPDFITSSLGIQNKGKGLFSGFGKLLGAAGAVGGLYRGAVGGFRASRMANDINNGNDPDQHDRFRNRWLRPVLSGITGGFRGGGVALREAATANDHQYRRALNRVNQMNAERMGYAADGGTWLGGVGSGWRQALTGQSSYELLQNQETMLKRQAEEAKGRKDALAAIQSMAKEKASSSTSTSGRIKIGNTDMNLNYNEFIAKRQAAASAGKTEFEIEDGKNSGVIHTIQLSDAFSENITNDLLESNAGDWIYTNAKNPDGDVGLRNQLNEVRGYYDIIASDSKITADDAWDKLKKQKGSYAGQEFTANTALNRVREEMPRAKADDARGRHDYK